MMAWGHMGWLTEVAAFKSAGIAPQFLILCGVPRLPIITANRPIIVRRGRNTALVKQ